MSVLQQIMIKDLKDKNAEFILSRKHIYEKCFIKKTNAHKRLHYENLTLNFSGRIRFNRKLFKDIVNCMNTFYYNDMFVEVVFVVLVIKLKIVASTLTLQIRLAQTLCKIITGFLIFVRI